VTLRSSQPRHLAYHAPKCKMKSACARISTVRDVGLAGVSLSALHGASCNATYSSLQHATAHRTDGAPGNPGLQPASSAPLYTDLRMLQWGCSGRWKTARGIGQTVFNSAIDALGTTALYAVACRLYNMTAIESGWMAISHQQCYAQFRTTASRSGCVRSSSGGVC
jgi:hypothetical protein